MAKSKRLPPLPPLPVRVAKLHAKLVIAIILGIAVAAIMTPLELRWLPRALAGWDVGVAVYLALTFSLMWRADVAQIRRRASEQDEGAPLAIARRLSLPRRLVVVLEGEGLANDALQARGRGNQQGPFQPTRVTMTTPKVSKENYRRAHITRRGNRAVAHA